MFSVNRRQYILKMASGKSLYIYLKPNVGICAETLSKDGTWQSHLVIKDRGGKLCIFYVKPSEGCDYTGYRIVDPISRSEGDFHPFGGGPGMPDEQILSVSPEYAGTFNICMQRSSREKFISFFYESLRVISNGMNEINKSIREANEKIKKLKTRLTKFDEAFYER